MRLWMLLDFIAWATSYKNYSSLIRVATLPRDA